MSDSSKQIKIGAVISYVSILINIASGLIYTPWMVAQIGKGDYGLYTLSQSIIGMFIMDFGIGSAITVFLSKIIAEKDEQKLNNFLSTVYKLYFIIDAVICVIFIVMFTLIDSIYANLTQDELVKMKVIFCISAGYNLISFLAIPFGGILSSYERFIALKFSTILHRILQVLINVVVLSLGLGLYALVIVNSLSGLIQIIYLFYNTRKCVRIKFTPGIDKALFKDIFFYSIWITVVALAERLVLNITPTILGITIKEATSAIAVFGVVMTLEGYIYLIANVFSGMFIPKISRIVSEENHSERLNVFCNKVGRIQFLINGLIICGFAVVGREFITLWMGPDFIDAYKTLLLIAIPALFVNSIMVPGNVLAVKKMPNYQAYTCVFSGITNIILIFPLSHYFGLIGAGISIGTAYIVRTISTLVFAQKKADIKALKIVKNCFIKLSIPLALSIATSLLLTHYISIDGWIGLIIKGIVAVAAYIIVFWLVGLNREEKSMVFGIIKVFKRKFLHKG